MNRPLYLLYIPGLGDSKVTWQRRVVGTWRLWGVKSELVQMNWADGKPWQPKFDRLLRRIDSYHSQGYRVALVGASAGAAAVINAYAARRDKIQGCVIISGKVNFPDRIGERVRAENPAFITAAYDCQSALASLTANDRQRILSIYAVADELVHKSDSLIPGANNRRVVTIGHGFTIAFQIVFGAGCFIGFIKKLPRL